ncbi:conserved hypothetical protein [Gammaproteobacteria bacterium]
MFDCTKLIIDSYVTHLQNNYLEVYSRLEPDYPGILGFCGRIALESIANTDAAYHGLTHTIQVTEAGQEILRGKHISQGGVSPRDWLHVVISLLCHDIGYVRGVCRGDENGYYVRDFDGNTVTLPLGSTDAALTPYHVTRSQIFVRERFGAAVAIMDTNFIISCIERTRFPVPKDNAYAATNDYPGLVRAADLIGQMGDMDYLRKCAALYREFEETGAARILNYTSPDDLRRSYPKFFWATVHPLINDALRYLQVTQEGRQLLNNLFANVFIEEHQYQGVFKNVYPQVAGNVILA